MPAPWAWMCFPVLVCHRGQWTASIRGHTCAGAAYSSPCCAGHDLQSRLGNTPGKRQQGGSDRPHRVYTARCLGGWYTLQG